MFGAITTKRKNVYNTFTANLSRSYKRWSAYNSANEKHSTNRGRSMSGFQQREPVESGSETCPATLTASCSHTRGKQSSWRSTAAISVKRRQAENPACGGFSLREPSRVDPTPGALWRSRSSLGEGQQLRRRHHQHGSHRRQLGSQRGRAHVDAHVAPVSSAITLPLAKEPRQSRDGDPQQKECRAWGISRWALWSALVEIDHSGKEKQLRVVESALDS
jgi:hypothetical protein